MAVQVPSIGRVVHFVLASGKHCPALITEVNWHDGHDQSLTIFPPQSEPFWDVVSYSEDPKRGTWHWPEYVPAKEA
jgi:hypothetical protein